MSIEFFELLQLNDATFPIGSYTHSWGLETFVQKGIIRDSQTAESYFRSELESNFLTNDFFVIRPRSGMQDIDVPSGRLGFIRFVIAEVITLLLCQRKLSHDNGAPDV